MLILWPILTLLAAVSSLASDDIYGDCIRGNDAALCAMAAPRLNFDQKFTMAYEAMKKSCRLDKSLCHSELMLLAKKVGRAAEIETESFFKSNCRRDADYCDAYSRILEDQKKYPEALEAARKYFRKNTDGPLAFFAYQFGSKSEAFESSIKTCRNVTSTCAFYLRYMPDHPLQTELLANVINNCFSVKMSEGATSCAIGGTFLLKKDKKEAAFKLLESDCKKNLSSCMIILAAFKSDSEIIRATLSLMCEPHKNFTFVTHQDFHKKFCAEGTPKSVSAELQAEANRFYSSYQLEQKI